MHLKKFNQNLKPTSIHSDCENSFIAACKSFFPRIKIELCEVHCIRSWERNLKTFISRKQFNENKKVLNKALCLLRGSFYMPIDFLNNLLLELTNIIKPKLNLNQNLQWF